MEITEVKVFPVNEEKLKAFVSIVFDRCFMVNDIKIIQGRDGLFISMPSRKKKNGEFKDVAHPLNNETRQMIELQVVEEYERVLAERGESLPAPARAFADVEERSEEPEPMAPAASPPPAAAPPPPAAQPAAAAPQAAMAAADGDGKPAAGGPPAAAGSRDRSDKESDEKSLEEVQELHLRDSFWSVS
jgi:stage V sporulation protein G